MGWNTLGWVEVTYLGLLWVGLQYLGGEMVYLGVGWGSLGRVGGGYLGGPWPPFCSVTGTGVAETPLLPKFRRKRPKQRMPRIAPGDGAPHPAPPTTPASVQSQPRRPKTLECK